MKLFEPARCHGNIVFKFEGSAVDQLSAYATGYHDAGKTLASQLEKAPGYADYEGYPILFLYRHALELYLKAIVYSGAKLVGLISDETVDYQKLFQRHTLGTFLPALKVIWDQMGWSWDFGVDGFRSLSDFKSLIEEWDRIDRNSDVFRYPIKKNFDANLPEHFVVNVVMLSRRMDPILECLDGVVTGIDTEWDHAAEIIYETEQIIRDAL